MLRCRAAPGLLGARLTARAMSPPTWPHKPVLRFEQPEMGRGASVQTFQQTSKHFRVIPVVVTVTSGTTRNSGWGERFGEGCRQGGACSPTPPRVQVHRRGGGLSANLRPVPFRHLLPAGPGSGWSPGRGTGLGPAEGSVTPFASVPQACGAVCDRDTGGSEQSRGRSDPQRRVLTRGSGSWGPVRPQLHPGRPGKPLRDVTGAPRLLLRRTPQERPLLLKRAVASEPQ